MPFIVSIFIYPLKTEVNPLFESIMPLVIAIMVVTLVYSYLKSIKADLIREDDDRRVMVYNQYNH